ncbi:MAG: transglycosylase SLT domain-containing protein [Dongiaceae bacterium]
MMTKTLSFNQGFYLAGLLLAGLLFAWTTQALANTADEKLCQAAIAKIERLNNFPVQILSAVALTESGRLSTDKKTMIAWPWSINAEGKDYVFNSKADAIAFTQKLMKGGMRSIDVGCMQINLRHHPDAFVSLEQAFDPNANAAYAAKFLKTLLQNHKAWTKAIAYYHSSAKEYNEPYRQRVLKNWQTARRQADQERQAAYAALAAQRRPAQIAFNK